jgi:hypothetical protein
MPRKRRRVAVEVEVDLDRNNIHQNWLYFTSSRDDKKVATLVQESESSRELVADLDLSIAN